MSLEPKNRDDTCSDNAAEVLSEITDEPIEEFEPSEYTIPDIEDQDIIVPAEQ